MKKQDVLVFLQTVVHAVIATSSKDGTTEAAFIGLAQTDRFELIFGTYNTSRKYKNLRENTRVSFVVTSPDELVTVQIDGTAYELDDKEKDPYVATYLEKIPSAKIFSIHPEQSYWKVIPTWMRYTDVRGEKEIIEEFTF